MIDVIPNSQTEPRAEFDTGPLKVVRYVGSFDTDAVKRLAQPLFEKHVFGETTCIDMVHDISRLRFASPKSLFAFVELAKRASPRLRYNAIVGMWTSAGRFLVSRGIALAGRDDVGHFETETEARRWLQSKQQTLTQQRVSSL